MTNSEQAKENQGNSNPRVVSLQRLATMLDRDRNTITKYIGQGLPIISAADKKLGRATEIDLAAAVRWLEERAAELAASSVVIDPDGMPKEEADRRRAVALAYMAELELEEAKKEVVRVYDVSAMVAKEYAEVRAALQSVPAKLASRIAGQNDPNIVKDEIEKSIRHALKSLKYDSAAT